MSLDTNNTFNFDFECPAHSSRVFGFKYLSNVPLRGFLGLHYRRVPLLCAKEFSCSTFSFAGLVFYTSASRTASDSCFAVILKVKANFNR